MPDAQSAPVAEMILPAGDVAAATVRMKTGAKIPLLGEELPIFCERCGYSLHGLAPIRCGDCQLLRFDCPECGHHQPINTLRPAAQRVLGRVRASALFMLVLLKLNLFGWPLFGWFVAGYEYAYSWQYYAQGAVRMIPPRFGWDDFFGFALCGFFFGAVARMALLRWRRGMIVAVVVAGLVVVAEMLGAEFRRIDRSVPQSPFNASFLTIVALSAGWVWAGAASVWPLWVMLVRVFLPTKAADALLDWQRSIPNRAAALARE